MDFFLDDDGNELPFLRHFYKVGTSEHVSHADARLFIDGVPVGTVVTEPALPPLFDAAEYLRELQPFTEVPLGWLAVRLAGNAVLAARLAEIDTSPEADYSRVCKLVARLRELGKHRPTIGEMFFETLLPRPRFHASKYPPPRRVTW